MNISPADRIAATRNDTRISAVSALFILIVLASSPEPVFGAGVQDGTWTGSTGNARVYELTTQANKIVTLKVGFASGGCSGSTVTNLGLTIGSSGFFSTSFSTGPTAGIITTSGTFDPVAKTASGTVSFSGGNCSGSVSTTWTATLTPTVPGAPTIGTATALNAMASVTFTPPTSDGNSPITAYTATCGSQSASGSTSPIVVTGLTNGTPVTCTVLATNAVGNSPSSAPSNSVIPAPVPTVGSPTSSGITGTAATLGGNVTSDGGSAITERGIVHSLTATNADPLILGAGVTKSVVTGTTGLFSSGITGLSPVSAYSFKAYATNAVGTSYTSVATFTTVAAAPGAPTIGTATAGDTTVSVTFTAPTSTGGSAITGYTATCGTKSASASASPITVTGLTNGAAVTCTVVATNAAGNSAASAASNSVTPGPQGTNIPRLVNIATRAKVQTGDNVMIAGFIIGGNAPKKVLITSRGPSLAVAPFNVPGTVADPFIQLFSGATQIDSNDDFGTRANAGEIPATVKPSNAKEAAILTTLNPGAYTAIITGVGGTSGVAIVEVFEIDLPEIPLINIATRSRVETGDNVMIAGFVIQGNASRTVLVTARGPSLAVAPFNVPNTLPDPYLRIFSGQTVIFENDNWMDGANANVIPETQKPKDPKDAALLVTLAPGAYTVIVGGGAASTASGVAIVEVFVQ